VTRPSSATYSPGAWVAASSESAWLLVDLALDDARLAECWSALAADDADRVIDVLLSRGLGGLPGFALVLARASATRVVARHPALVTCRRDGAEPTVVTGAEGRTWTDVELPGEYDEIALSAGGDAPGPIRLPLAQGITPAGVLTVSAASGPIPASIAAEDRPSVIPAPDADSAPGPTPAMPEPEPEPEPEVAREERPDEEPVAGTGASYYGRLLGATVDRDALLAELAESEADDEEQASPVASPSESVPSGHTAIWEPEDRAPDASDSDETTAPTTGPPARAGDSALDGSGATGGLIDGVPWASGSNAASTAPPPAEPFVVAPGFSAPTPVGPPPPTPAAEVGPPQPTASSAPPSPTPAAEAGTPETEVRTVNRAELLKSLAAPAHPGPTVLAVRCPRSHLSSAYSAHCRVCGELIEEQVPTEHPRPALGRLVLSTGETVILDRDVVLGRAPESTEEDPALRPNLVRLTDSGEVSRVHVRVTLDGWQPMIRDLGSSNGTTLTLTSSSPQQLRPQEDYVLEPGCEVTLADVVSFRFDVTA
jgi:hypothetical protein